MASRLNPYLGFSTTAREALEFYQGIFGGTLVLNTYGQYGDPAAPNADKIMHGMLETDRGYTLMAADSPEEPTPAGGPSTSMSLSGDDADDLRGYWEKLKDGASVTVPLEKQMWGDEFGTLTDKFGITWMVNITQAA